MPGNRLANDGEYWNYGRVVPDGPEEYPPNGGQTISTAEENKPVSLVITEGESSQEVEEEE